MNENFISYTFKYTVELPATSDVRIRKTDGTDFTDEEIEAYCKIAE